MKNIRKEKGITLIALVITIIVLLIIAGVAISMLSGENGILTRASEAKKQTENKSEEEQVKLIATEAMMKSDDYTVTENILKELLDKSFGEINKDYKMIPIRIGWEIVIDKTQNHYSVAKDGSASYLEWYYKEDTNNQNRRTIVTNGEIELKVGDYINYNLVDTTEDIDKTTYTSPTGTTRLGNDYYVKAEENPIQGSGCSTEQTFDGKSYTGKWEVLGIDEKTGEILIVSADTVKTTKDTGYGLKGFTGYQYGETELNNICKIFGYGKGASGARSINVDDVNRLTGYNPNNTGVYDPEQIGEGKKFNEGKDDQYGNKVKYTWNSTTLGKVDYEILNFKNGIKYTLEHLYNNEIGFNWYDETTKIWKSNTVLKGDITTLTLSEYWYDLATLNENDDGTTVGIETTSSEYETLTCTKSSYWLASTDICGANDIFFGVMFINAKGELDSVPIYSADGMYEGSSYQKVRPVVSLESDIKLEYDETNEYYDIK